MPRSRRTVAGEENTVNRGLESLLMHLMNEIQCMHSVIHCCSNCTVVGCYFIVILIVITTESHRYSYLVVLSHSRAILVLILIVFLRATGRNNTFIGQLSLYGHLYHQRLESALREQGYANTSSISHSDWGNLQLVKAHSRPALATVAISRPYWCYGHNLAY